MGEDSPVSAARRLLPAGVLLAAACATGPRATPAVAPPAPPPALAASPSREAVAVAGPFALHSAFRVNLHHFLYVLTRARKGLDSQRPAVTRALAETGDLARLSAEERAGWDRALAHYAAEIAVRDAVFDEMLVEAKAGLVGCPDGVLLRSCGVPEAMARALEDAAPAYRRLWWPAHDRANREWIAGVTPMVTSRGEAMAQALGRAFATRWPSAPVRVDVVAYANWAGAYTTRDPAHVTVGSRAPNAEGTLAFEVLFHEVLHALDDGLAIALGDAAREGNKRTRGLGHAILFYTVGELTRRLFPGHVPYAEKAGLWTQAPMARLRPILRTHWQPFLDGQGNFEEAVRKVVAAL
jgi:hypothetical protein